MAKQRLRRKDSAPSTAVSRPELDTEFANRLIDPFETHYLGILRTNDPLLLERGNGGVELYRDLRRDGKVFSGLQKRQLALVGKSWQVEPVDKENAKAKADAEVLTHILKGFGFDQMCKDFLESLLAGFSVGETVWTIRDDLVVPERVIKRAQRRFVFVQDDEHAPAQLHLLTRNAMQRGIPVPERKFIVHRVNPEDDNPYGTGLGLQLFWPVYFKRKGIVAWNKLCDRFGSPTPHGKYPRGASPKEKATLADALRAFSNDGWMMTPEGMDIALLESKLSGNVTTQQQLCEYMDDWIAEILTGQEPARASGGAVAAASKERRDVRQDLTQADSDLLSDTLNGTLIKWICELNGLEPCLVYRNIKEEEDTKAMAEADKIVSEMGFELDEPTVRGRYGEGWHKKQTTAVQPSPGTKPTGPASFAEPGRNDPTQTIVSQLGTGAAPVVGEWIGQLRQLVNEYSDPEQLQRALLGQFGDLATQDLTELMGLAFELAHLQGRASAQESSLV
jgi:phage gp29-like protein